MPGTSGTDPRADPFVDENAIYGSYSKKEMFYSPGELGLCFLEYPRTTSCHIHILVDEVIISG